MNLNDYQQDAVSTAQYPVSTSDFDESQTALIYQALWMAGFVGNICNQVKKMLRDDNGVLTEDRKQVLDKLIDSAIQSLGWLGQSINKESNVSEKLNLDECIGLCYTSLGLIGEAGEFCDKAKHLMETDDEETIIKIKEDLCDELGDVEWYVASSAKELDRKLDSICEDNLAKLKDREERNVIQGSGNNR